MPPLDQTERIAAWTFRITVTLERDIPMVHGSRGTQTGRCTKDNLMQMRRGKPIDPAAMVRWSDLLRGGVEIILEAIASQEPVQSVIHNHHHPGERLHLLR